MTCWWAATSFLLLWTTSLLKKQSSFSGLGTSKSQGERHESSSLEKRPVVQMCFVTLGVQSPGKRGVIGTVVQLRHGVACWSRDLRLEWSLPGFVLCRSKAARVEGLCYSGPGSCAIHRLLHLQ